MNALKTLMQTHFPRTPKIRLSKPSLHHRLLTYHLPAIDLLSVSRQDRELSLLNAMQFPISDVAKEDRFEREERMRRRGKHVRVGVLTGLARKPESADKKKKKRK